MTCDEFNHQTAQVYQVDTNGQVVSGDRGFHMTSLQMFGRSRVSFPEYINDIVKAKIRHFGRVDGKKFEC